VLNNTPVSKPQERMALTESRVAVTGDKTAKNTEQTETTNVFEIQRLAGLK